jgi:hypothetical protein
MHPVSGIAPSSYATTISDNDTCPYIRLFQIQLPRLFYPSPPLNPDFFFHVPTYDFTGPQHQSLSCEIFGDDNELTQVPAHFGLLYFHNDAFDIRKALLTPPMCQECSSLRQAY